MPSQCQITIQMSQQTVQSLLENGFSLYAFHAVQASGGGSPLVWYETQTYSLSTALAWTESYQAYTSRSQIVPNGQIMMNATYDIDPGQQLNVTNPAGTGMVELGGPPNAVSILNQTSSQFTCGLAVEQPGGYGYGPVCALPLFGNTMVVIVPVLQVFLMFASTPMNVGTVVQRSSGSGVLVDLTGSPSRSVTFDINNGWQPGPGVQPYPPNTSLAPLLLQSPY